MRTLPTIFVLLALSAEAHTKPAPLDLPPVAPATDAMVRAFDPAGAAREADYFRAPQQPNVTDRLFLCRLELRPFDKTRMAHSCN